jgi:protein SCO1/2
MTARTHRLILVAAAFATGLFGCFMIILLVTDRTPIRAVQSAAIGGPFQLIDQDGRTVTDVDFKGKPLLVFFGYTHCPDVCPTTLFELSEVMRKLGPEADKVNAVFVTVDPERDTPAVMKDYMSSFDPHVRGLTGDNEAIAKVLRQYRVYAKKAPQPNGDYAMDHTAIVYLMDKDGRFVAPFNAGRKVEDAAADLRRYI